MSQVKLGETIELPTKEILGLVTGEDGRHVQVKLRCVGESWRFDCFGPGGVGAHSNYSYKSANAAKRGAEHMAHAILDLRVPR